MLTLYKELFQKNQSTARSHSRLVTALYSLKIVRHEEKHHGIGKKRVELVVPVNIDLLFPSRRVPGRRALVERRKKYFLSH